MATGTIFAAVEELHPADPGRSMPADGAAILTLRILAPAREPVPARARLVRSLRLAMRTVAIPARMPVGMAVTVAVPVITLRAASRMV